LFGGERGAINGSFGFARGGKMGRAKANVPFVCRLKKFRAVGIFLFFFFAMVSAVFRLAVADNDLKICELADLELQPVDLQQRYD
jgi:hypothetical protein